MGISTFDGTTWTKILPWAETRGFSGDSVEAIVFDDAGRAWVGGGVGVAVLAEGKGGERSHPRTRAWPATALRLSP